MNQIKGISEETRQALQGLAPFSTRSTIDFTPESYRIKRDGVYIVEESAWPVFKIRPWTKGEAGHIRKSMPKYADSRDDSEIREYVRRAVVGWENLIDAGTGELIEYVEEQNGGASKELFDIFPSALVTDILNKSLAISGIVDMERAALKS